MSICFTARAVACIIAPIVALNASLAQQTQVLPTVVVTASRNPLEITHSGSSISVVEAAEIERVGARGIAEALRAVPGVDVRERGGIGTVATVALRGATPGQTLVLVDGIRVGDPTGTDGALDFGSLAVLDIERIEVLRGPQSALYGSDAMGGVVNIITRRGGEPRRTALVEAGSYGTWRARGAVSGSVDRFDYAFATEMLHSDGFARYVDRAAQRAGLWPPVPKSDPTDRQGFAGRIGYRGDGFEIEASAQGHFNRIKTDNGFAFLPANVYSPFNQARQWTGVAFARGSFDAFDGMLKNKLTLSHTSINRASADTESCPDFFSNCVTHFRGERQAAEYQGDLKTGSFGTLSFGARTETETARTSEDLPAGYVPTPFDFPFDAINKRQTTNSVFASQQMSLGADMDLSLGGRMDAVQGGKTFPTWRATWAYRLPGTGTKFRASAGTGARNPSLFQRFSSFGDATLRPEYNTGFDGGVDQSLFDGRLTLSASAFHNKYRDLIDFRFFGCAPAQIFGCYFNVGRAVTYGGELAAEAVLVPETWRARASYTHLVAKNDLTGEKLLQRARHKGTVSIFFTGVPKLEIEARATMVSSKLDFGPVKLAPYAKFDLFADYKLTNYLTLTGRIENLGGARYEETFNYQVAGRSFYAGLKGTW